MRSSDITLTIVIILIFVAMYFYNILAVGIKNIQDNWPEYRCNPSIMPFAGMFGHDAGSNFTFCIQNMQTDFMGYLLQPLTYLTSVQNISDDHSIGLPFTVISGNVVYGCEYVYKSPGNGPV